MISDEIWPTRIRDVVSFCSGPRIIQIFLERNDRVRVWEVKVGEQAVSLVTHSILEES